MLKLSGLLLFALLFSSCYEDVEGCLDVNATNYDLDADIICPDDCCEYPELSIRFRHTYDGEPLSSDRFYIDGAGNQFRINQLRYYWSDVQLLTANGDSIEPQSELQIGLVNSAGDTILEIVNNNLALVQFGRTAATSLGSFRTEETVSGLVLQSGVEENYQRAAPSTAPNNHPLAFQEGRLHYGLDTGYVQLKLEYDFIEGEDTTASVINTFSNQPIFLDFGAPILLPRGFDVAVTVETDVAALLGNLNLGDDTSFLAEEIVGRIPFIFRVVPE